MTPNGDDVPIPALVPPAPVDAGAAPLKWLGDFRIIREIGRGGMGIVYEAEQESLGRRVALKVLLGNALLDSRQLPRFQREARAAARLHHTNIVPVFGVGEHLGTHYYVMQFIKGRGIDSVLAELRWRRDRHESISPRSLFRAKSFGFASPDDSTNLDLRPLDLTGEYTPTAGAPQQLRDAAAPLGVEESAVSPAEEHPGALDGRDFWNSVANIGRQVADALDYAHRQGVLHRDIKPANLLLDTQGTVWITDFGLAKAAEQDNVTQTGDIVGTLRYMAPECFSAQGDARSDLYALGLTLYELLTLRPAFDAPDRHALVKQVTEAAVLPARKANASIPRDLETIVMKAVERDPAHRYQTAGELAADLDRFMRDEPIHARRLNSAERLARWCRRNPMVATLSGLLLLAFLTGFAGVTWAWRVSENQRVELQEAQDEIERQRSLAEAIKDFLVDSMLTAASPELARGRQVTVEDVLHEAGQRINSALAAQPEMEASIRTTIGTTFHRLGQHEQAEPHLRRALELTRAKAGDEAFQTLAAMNNLAESLKAQGKLAEAEPLYFNSWQIRLREYGADEPETLGALNNYAQLLHAEGRLAEAEKLLRESLAAHRRVFGENDLDTWQAQASLGLVLQSAGRAGDAEPLIRSALEGLRRGLGADHPLVMTAEHNLAGVLRDLRRTDEAEKLYRHSLEARQRVLPEGHLDTLLSLNQFATFLQEQGRLAEAEPLVRSMYDRSLRSLGPEHPQTIAARNNLARMLQSLGQPEEAEPILRENIEICRRVLGPDHPDTLLAMTNLGVALQSLAKLEEAEPLAREVVETQRLVLGADHPHTLVSINNLAVLLQARGKLAEAEPLVTKNLADCRRVLGLEHPDTLLAMSNQAALLVARNHWDEAEPLLRESLEIRARAIGPDHPDTLNALDDLVVAALAVGKLNEAAELLTRLVGTRNRVLGETHPDAVKSLAMLADVERQQGNSQAAAQRYAELLAARRKSEGSEHPNTVAALNQLSRILIDSGAGKAAQEHVRELLRILRAKLPPTSPQIAEVLAMLATAEMQSARPVEAEALLREGLEIDRGALPEGHWHIARLESLLGRSLSQQKKYAEAEPLLVGAFGVLRLVRPNHPREADEAMEWLIENYTAAGKTEMADDYRNRYPVGADAPQPADSADMLPEPRQP